MQLESNSVLTRDHHVKKYWNKIVAQGQSDFEIAEFDQELREHWLRCQHRQRYDHWPQLSYAKGVTLSSIKKKKARLIDMAIPVIEDIHEFLENKNCALLLTDETGCTLSLYSDKYMKTQLTELGLTDGVYWREDILGNTAISTAIHQAKVAQTVGYQHFKQALHSLACYAAPLFNNEGNILGSIAMILPIHSASDFILGLIYSASKEIGTNLYADYCLSESNQHLSEVHVLLEGVEEGVLAWDSKGTIHYLNSKGSNLLGLTSSKVLGCEIDSVINLPPQIKHAIAAKQDLAMFETSIEINQRLISLWISLRLVKDEHGEIHTSMVLMHPIEHIRQIVHHQVGNQARLTFEDIEYQSEDMHRVIRLAQHAAKGRGSVFLHGEEGLGKTDLAQAIHNASDRSNKAFISINCQAIPQVSMNTEFLGSDANSANPFPSKFELASGGTLFLEHVECLTAEIQAALLHLLKTGLINRLNHTILPVDVRVIATSDIDITQYVDEKRFGRQLMYELQSFDIYIPPLRQRIDDIAVLANRTLKFLRGNSNKNISLANDAMKVLSQYHWPGNNRELRNVLERAFSYGNGRKILERDLPDSVRQTLGHTPEIAAKKTLAETERDAITCSAIRCSGKPSKMCLELNISRTSLWRKLKTYQITLNDFK
ncbi:dihydroxyacetone kinase operon transcriptional regulator DhaR [Vibrio sp. MA40-2]|uniref:dihydroxyacetone kinase operon transcriptional regulator DhaR n=1 Tax=Vibrio sp. MA40-2 TaxID=3391828 RepID=UPI0039A531D8